MAGLKHLKKPIVISFFNNKGGVGKSTLSGNLASKLADEYNVLLIDNDPQGNVSELLGQEQDAEIRKAYLGKDFAIRPIDFNPKLIELEKRKRSDKRLSILTGGNNLLEVETLIKDKPARETILKRNLDEAIKDFDFVIIDNPPSKSVFVWNALYASDFVIIPFKPSLSEFSGIKSLKDMIDTMKTDLQHELKILGILINMYTKSGVTDMYVTQVQETFDPRMVFDSGVRVAVNFMVAMPFGLPVDLLFGEKEDVVEMITAVKEEMIKKLEEKLWI
jgi:chromosome partitioning protein